MLRQVQYLSLFSKIVCENRNAIISNFHIKILSKKQKKYTRQKTKSKPFLYFVAIKKYGERTTFFCFFPTKKGPQVSIVLFGSRIEINLLRRATWRAVELSIKALGDD